MNVFFIPSWYPSITNPLPGIFFKDQAIALAGHYPGLNIGISTWGQNDDRLLLWSKQPVRSFMKVLMSKPQQSIHKLNDNLIEYFTPTYTWTSKIKRGNMKNILAANLHNFHAFEQSSGKVDLLHAHVGFPAGYLAEKLAEIHNVPYIITEQMSPFPHKYFIDSEGMLNERLLMAFQNSTKNIAISKALANKMKRFDIQNVSVIANLVDENFFKPAEPALKNEKFTFFSLGRIVPQKGIDILLHAFAKLKEDAQLKIGGDGEYVKQYQKLAKSLNIEQKVRWLGRLDRTSALKEYQCCDAFVLPSRHESMGVVFAEAMACGKPVIGTVCGGPEEFINASNGIIVPPEDISALVGAMGKMITNYHVFDPKKIRAQFEERFSSKVVCSQIRNVYEEVVESCG